MTITVSMEPLIKLDKLKIHFVIVKQEKLDYVPMVEQPYFLLSK